MLAHPRHQKQKTSGRRDVTSSPAAFPPLSTLVKPFLQTRFKGNANKKSEAMKSRAWLLFKAEPRASSLTRVDQICFCFLNRGQAAAFIRRQHLIGSDRVPGATRLCLHPPKNVLGGGGQFRPIHGMLSGIKIGRGGGGVTGTLPLSTNETAEQWRRSTSCPETRLAEVLERIKDD